MQVEWNLERRRVALERRYVKISQNVRQDMTSEGRGPKWNGEVTEIRPKKNGGLGVLPV